MSNSPSVFYIVAATIWLVLGFGTGNVMYLVLAAVFYVLAIRRWHKKKK